MKASETLIVIGREFGSGGRALGRELSKRLSVPFYDKELLHQAAKQFGISLPEFERNDERKPSVLRSMVESAFGMCPANSSNVNSDTLHALQSCVIEKLARQGGAVFVGRTADYVLRNNPRLLSIFVHCDEEGRARRIVKRGDCKTQEEALDMARRNDRLRQSYYNFYTGRQWGNAANYHLCIDLGKLGLQTAVDIVLHATFDLAQRIK